MKKFSWSSLLWNVGKAVLTALCAYFGASV